MPRGAWVLPAALAGAALGILAADPGTPTPPAIASATPLLVLAGLFVVTLRMLLPRGRGRFAALLVGSLLLAGALGIWRAAQVGLPEGAGSVAAWAAAADDGGTGRELEVQGVVVDDPRPKEDKQQVVLDAITIGGRPAAGKLLAWLPRGVEVASGDRVAFSATLERPQDFNGFAYRAFLARQGVGAIGRAYTATVLAHGSGIGQSAADLRRFLLEGFNRIVPEPEAALGAGILLGVRSSIDPQVNDAFAIAGLTHVVAISGWNIAIIGALVARMLEGLRRRGAGSVVPLLTVLIVTGYVVLVGASPSVVRAALMAAAMLLGRGAGTRAHAASALMLAALLMLLVAPPVLWDVGFQLSLLATAGLIAFGAGLEARLAALPGWLREPIALTTAAQLATLPIILLTFERFSLVAPFANVVVAPLVPLVMLASAVAAPIGALDGALHVPVIGEVLSWLAGGGAWLGLRSMIATGTAAASVPLAALPLAAPAWLPAVWYPMLAVAWRLQLRARTPEVAELRGLRAAAAPGILAQGIQLMAHFFGALVRGMGRIVGSPVRAVAALTVVLGTTTLTSLPDGRLHLRVLDIGQGDGILVTAPDGATMLIDGGPDPDVTLRRLGAAMPWWERSLDIVVLSHPHQDHVGGLPEVLRRFRVTTILDSGRAYANPTYDRFLALARTEPGATLRLGRAGQRMRMDPRTSFELWYPTPADAAAPLPDADINNASIVGLLRYGGFSALLTGDARASLEELFAERGQLRRIDVLKIGHHGSNFSSSPPFLATTKPRTGVISVGAGNPYGHPGATTLRSLQAARVQVLRTDLDGTVSVETDGTAWSVTVRGATSAPQPVRGGDPSRATRSPNAHLSNARYPDATPRPRAGTIGPWRFRTARRRGASWRRATFRQGSSRTRRASPPWPGRLRDCSRMRAYPSTSDWSRAPPCCMTSTSR